MGKVKILEKDVLKACRELLNLLEAQDQLYYTRIQCGATLRGGKFSMNTDMKGMEDLQVYLERGITLHIEVKRPDGDLSESQRVRRQKLERLRHYCYVVKSVEDLERILRKHGVGLRVAG